jgi:hypothetical protein
LQPLFYFIFLFIFSFFPLEISGYSGIIRLGSNFRRFFIGWFFCSGQGLFPIILFLFILIFPIYFFGLSWYNKGGGKFPGVGKNPRKTPGEFFPGVNPFFIFSPFFYFTIT